MLLSKILYLTESKISKLWYTIILCTATKTKHCQDTDEYIMQSDFKGLKMWKTYIKLKYIYTRVSHAHTDGRAGGYVSWLPVPSSRSLLI